MKHKETADTTATAIVTEEPGLTSSQIDIPMNQLTVNIFVNLENKVFNNQPSLEAIDFLNVFFTQIKKSIFFRGLNNYGAASYQAQS